MNNERLKEVLKKHEDWLRTRFSSTIIGECANLCDADLRGADLCGANLRDANLYGADLYGADLRGADLYGANLRGANLYGANLCDANLRGANLRGANLYDVNLRGADLCGANHNEGTGFYSLQCPEKGAFVGYKKADNKIVELQITEDAKRSSATTRKCRCSKAIVISITNLDGSANDLMKVESSYDKNFIYKVGETVEVQDFNEDRWVECTDGIHFFITRYEAVKY
jgi:uncharacterized protein YjbI with pentapeptide repeats